MKRFRAIWILLPMAFAGCQGEKEVWLEIGNPLEFQRDDARLKLTREEVAAWTTIPGSKVPIITDSTGTPIPCQADDLDGDGTWDELFALPDLGPGSSMRVKLSFIPPGEVPSFTVRTNLRLGAYQPGYPELDIGERLQGITYHNHSKTGEVYQMEGPAWENDLVGFRNYLDQRNGMDIFGKTTREMVLDSVGLAGGPSYHEPDWWGMDVLKVGTSLGSGAIAYRLNDSLYRVGDTGSGTYVPLMEGPLHSSFHLQFTGWKLGGNEAEVIHTIEIVAGRHFYESRVTCQTVAGPLELVPGIVNMKSDSLFLLELHEDYTGLMTHDYQAEDTTLLAMALVVPSALLQETGQTNDSGEGITQTYFAALKAAPGNTIPFRFYAFWEREDPRWASHEEVIGYLKKDAERWASPVTVQRRE